MDSDIRTQTIKIDTWPKILKYNYETYGARHKAMRFKHNGIWLHYTWQDYYHNVKYFALGLLSLGFKPGDRLMIIGDNTPEWYFAELGAQANHGVSIGVYPDSNLEETKYIVKNSRAKFVIVQDQEQVDKLLEIIMDVPAIEKVIYWNYKGLAHYSNPILIGYREVLKIGREYEDNSPGLFERNIKEGGNEDACCIIYTSGTSCTAPKGAIHTYQSIKSSADHLLHLAPWKISDNVVFPLPPVGINEQLLGIGCHLISSSILNFAERQETQQQDFREIGPDIIFYNPRLWEAKAASIEARIQEADNISRFFFKWFMPVGLRLAELNYKKQKPKFWHKLVYTLGYFTLFRQIRDNLGLPKARICYTSGALINPLALKFYHALQIPLKNLYGSTEGGVLAGAKNNDILPETVGNILKGIEVRITNLGEITWRHNGMYTDYIDFQDMPNRHVDFGWFHSGDAGTINDEGHIIFQDRLEDRVKLKNGVILCPQQIESRLTFNPFIKDAWVIADPDKNYVSAIIVINYENVGKWAGQRKVIYTSLSELSQQPEIKSLIGKEIKKINLTLQRDVQLKKWINFYKEFDPDTAELTRNRKLRRRHLEERYKSIVNAIYQDKSEIKFDIIEKYRDGQTHNIGFSMGINTL